MVRVQNNTMRNTRDMDKMTHDTYHINVYWYKVYIPTKSVTSVSEHHIFKWTKSMQFIVYKIYTTKAK